jgi:hypothetical protein
MSKCTIWYDPKLDGYTLQCSFNPDFVDFIKSQIPASDRAFDPPTKNWKFNKKYADAVKNVAEKLFGKTNVSFISEQQVKGAMPSASKSSTLESALAQFMKLLPFDAANAAYRKGAMLLHPDHVGGSMEAMSNLNTLWDRIKAELYKEA